MIAVRSPASRASPRPRTRPGCATRSGVVPPPRAARGVPRARRRSARRSGVALRAHARPVPPRGRRRAVRPRAPGIDAAGARAARPSAAAWSRASFCPAAARASGATPRCCARSSGGRSRGCAARSSRSSRPRSAASSPSGRASARPRAGLDALLTAIEQLQGCAAPGLGARSRDPAGARRAATGRRISTASARPARWSGAASSRSAQRRPHRALPRRSPPAARPAAAGRPRASSARRPRAARRSAARSSSPTSPRETGAFARDLARRALGPGVGRRGHQRHARAAAVAAPRLVDARGRGAASAGRAFRSRRLGPPGSEGRWSLAPRSAQAPDARPSGAPRSRARCSSATAC